MTELPADPVSWLVIERGWPVVSSSGDELGSVERVLGDTDIFNGLDVSSGLLGSTTRYVPSELVVTIREGVVELSVDDAELDALQAEVRPPG